MLLLAFCGSEGGFISLPLLGAAFSADLVLLSADLGMGFFVGLFGDFVLGFDLAFAPERNVFLGFSP